MNANLKLNISKPTSRLSHWSDLRSLASVTLSVVDFTSTPLGFPVIALYLADPVKQVSLHALEILRRGRCWSGPIQSPGSRLEW